MAPGVLEYAWHCIGFISSFAIAFVQENVVRLNDTSPRSNFCKLVIFYFANMPECNDEPMVQVRLRFE